MFFLCWQLFFSLSAASAATYTLHDENDDYYYSNNAENYEVEFDSKSGSIWTENYKQVSSIKISDNKGKSKTLKKIKLILKITRVKMVIQCIRLFMLQIQVYHRLKKSHSKFFKTTRS